MNIIVCLKQVPDTADIKIDPTSKRLVREGVKAMSKSRHWIFLAAWAVLLVAAVVLFWDRVFPGAAARSPTTVSGPARSPSGASPAAANTPGAQEARLHEALKNKNPSYNGRGKFEEGGGTIVIADFSKTGLVDLSPLANGKLERLHIGQSAVTDLSPIQGLTLTRLIFTPERITHGMEVARNMASIREIGTTLDGRMSPLQFWPLYDQGKLAKAPCLDRLDLAQRHDRVGGGSARQHRNEGHV